MANIIKPKRSSVANKAPTTTDLTSGEIGVNMTDKKIFINNGTSIVQIASGSLNGLDDVVDGVIGIDQGGTGLSSVGSSGQVLMSNGTELVYETPSGASSAKLYFFGQF